MLMVCALIVVNQKGDVNYSFEFFIKFAVFLHDVSWTKLFFFSWWFKKKIIIRIIVYDTPLFFAFPFFFLFSLQMLWKS